MKAYLNSTVLLLLFAACSTLGKDEKAEKSGKTYQEVAVTSATSPDSAHADSKKYTDKRVWTQYKKVPVRNIQDTLPYANCNIEIQGNRFLYNRDKQLIYEDEVYVDTTFKYLVYGFRKHKGDKLIFLDDEGLEVVLKRDYYDGDHEYFKAVK